MEKLCIILGLSLLIFSEAKAAERTMSIQHLQNASSYFEVSVQDSGLLNGKYPGWCADWSNQISDNTVYEAKFYSSYAPTLPAHLVAKPENLDEANWLVNQHLVGEPSPSGLGVYTSGDLQLALWTLLDDNFDSSTVGPYSQARVNELVSASLSEGSGFRPSCKQVVIILLDPSRDGQKYQTTITEVPVYHFPKCGVPEGDDESER